MANKNITLRRKISGGFDLLHPETKKANIQASAGNATSTFGASIFDTGVALGNVDGYGTVFTSDELFATIDAAEARNAFEIAQEGHTHPNYFASISPEEYNASTTYSLGQYVQEDGKTYKYINATPSNNILPSNNVNEFGVGTAWLRVSEDVLTLDEILTTKVQLDVNSEIEYDQFPLFTQQGMRPQGTFTANAPVNGVVLADTAEDLFGTIVDYNSREEQVGVYKIASGTVDVAETYNDGTYNWTVRGHEDGVSVVSSGSITLENGDWLVYEKFESNTFYFSVINNQYRDATTGAKGVVEVTTETALSGYSNTVGARGGVIDEYGFRNATKDIREVIVFDNNSTVTFNYWTTTTTVLDNLLGTSDGEWAIVGTNANKAVYQRVNGTWTVDGVKTTSFPTSSAASIGGGGGITLYDNDNGVYYLTQTLTSTATKLITTNAEPLEDDLVFYIE